MKRTILALASLVAVTGALAQGTIVFKSKSGTAINAPVTLTDRNGVNLGQMASGSATAGGAGYYAELLAGTSATGSFTPVMGTKVGTSVEALVRGPFLSNGTGFFSLGDWTLKGISADGTSWFKVAAYYATDGTQTYAGLSQNIDNIVGTSAAFELKPGGGGTPPAPAAVLAGLQAWNVAVPEPSVLALGVLGLGALLLRRR